MGAASSEPSASMSSGSHNGIPVSSAGASRRIPPWTPRSGTKRDDKRPGTPRATVPRAASGFAQVAPDEPWKVDVSPGGGRFEAPANGVFAFGSWMLEVVSIRGTAPVCSRRLGFGRPRRGRLSHTDWHLFHDWSSGGKQSPTSPSRQLSQQTRPGGVNLGPPKVVVELDPNVASGSAIRVVGAGRPSGWRPASLSGAKTVQMYLQKWFLVPRASANV